MAGLQAKNGKQAEAAYAYYDAATFCGDEAREYALPTTQLPKDTDPRPPTIYLRPFNEDVAKAQAKAKTDYIKTMVQALMTEGKRHVFAATADLGGSGTPPAYDWACVKCLEAAENFFKALQAHTIGDVLPARGDLLTNLHPASIAHQSYFDKEKQNFIYSLANDIKAAGRIIRKAVLERGHTIYPCFGRCPKDLFTRDTYVAVVAAAKEILSKVEEMLSVAPDKPYEDWVELPVVRPILPDIKTWQAENGEKARLLIEQAEYNLRASSNDESKSMDRGQRSVTWSCYKCFTAAELALKAYALVTDNSPLTLQRPQTLASVLGAAAAGDVKRGPAVSLLSLASSLDGLLGCGAGGSVGGGGGGRSSAAAHCGLAAFFVGRSGYDVYEPCTFFRDKKLSRAVRDLAGSIVEAARSAVTLSARGGDSGSGCNGELAIK